MQKRTKNKRNNSSFFHATTDSFFAPMGDVERANKVEYENIYHKERGKTSFAKQLYFSQSDSRKDLIKKIKRIQTSSEKTTQRQSVFEPPQRVFLYNDKELEAIALESAKLRIQNKDNMEKKDIIKRKLMNLILGITESDLIEVARKV